MRKNQVNKLRNLVKKNYQEIADHFDVSRKKYVWSELEKLGEQVFVGANVLDAGCGNGRLLEVFKNKEINYLGFDNSEELLKLARKNYCNYKFIYSDIFNLENIENNYFDFIFLIAVIIHIPGKENRIKALQELGKKLKPGGKIFISTWNILEQKKFKKIVLINRLKNIFLFRSLEINDLIFPWKNQKGEKVSQRYYHAFSMKELKKLALKSNLNIKKIYKDKNNFWLILEK